MVSLHVEKISHSLADPLVLNLDSVAVGSGAVLSNLTSNATTATAAMTPQHPCELLVCVHPC